MNTDICEKCQRVISIGDFPFCPHSRGTIGLQPDTFNGAGQWVENLSPHGAVWVEGRADLKRKAAAQGLRWAPEGVTTSKVRKYDDDMKGRFNGGREPTFRTLHRPDTSTEPH